MDEIKKNEQCCENNSGDLTCACSSDGDGINKSDGGIAKKIVVSLLVLLAVVSIIAYKTIGADSNSGDASYEAMAIVAEPSDPELPVTTSTGSDPAPYQDDAIKAEQNTGEDSQIEKTGQNLGEYLESWSDLDSVAAFSDAVFVIVPDKVDVLVDDTIITTITEVKQYLENSSTKVGLYTLSYNSPEYSEIAQEFELPAVIIARKGAYAQIIPYSDIDEYNILQVYQACCDSSADCCPG